MNWLNSDGGCGFCLLLLLLDAVLPDGRCCICCNFVQLLLITCVAPRNNNEWSISV